jgi:hypothetical protein
MTIVQKHRPQSMHKPQLWFTPKPLRAKEDGEFKVLQIADTHTVTGVRVCEDVIDADRRPLPEIEADPLTVKFVGEVWDAKKPNLVILTGGKVDSGVRDTQAVLFKVVAPVIKRHIPWAAVFENRDDEGRWGGRCHVLLHYEERALQEISLRLMPRCICCVLESRRETAQLSVYLQAPLPLRITQKLTDVWQANSKCPYSKLYPTISAPSVSKTSME